MLTHTEDYIAKTPDMMGVAGRAWGLQLSTLREILRWPVETDPTVAAWLVEVPRPHPIFHSYYVFAMHLRPLPGRFPDPPHVRKFGATHEFWLYAAHPEFPRAPIIMGQAKPQYLAPPNFIGQFGTNPQLGPVVADAMARRFILNMVISPMVAGSLSPDTDQQQQWVDRFGDEMLIGSIPPKEKMN